MALVFLVEDGTQVANATSYATVAFADDYQSMNLHTATAWGLLTLAEKQYRLMWATHLIDTIVRFEGTQMTSTQPLAFPRQGVVDKEGFLIANNIIPPEVLQATAFMAGQLGNEDVTAIDQTRAFKKIKVDVIELTWRAGEYKTLIAPYLQSLLTGIGIVQAPGQLGFKPIVKG